MKKQTNKPEDQEEEDASCLWVMEWFTFVLMMALVFVLVFCAAWQFWKFML